MNYAKKKNSGESKEYLQHIIDLHEAIKLIIDPTTGKIISASQAACDFYGYSFDKLTTMHITDINTLSNAEIRQKMQSAKIKRQRFFKFKHKVASGDVRDVDVYSDPITIDDKTLLFSVIYDANKRKELERSLRESEAELQAIYQNSPLAMLLIDHNHQVIKINNAALSLIPESGSNIADLYGEKVLRCISNWKDCGFGPACNDCGLYSTVEKTFKQGKGFHRTEAKIPYHQTDTTNELDVLVSTTLLNISGKDAVLVSLENVTDRKRAERALAEADNIINRSPAVVFLWKNNEGWPVEFVTKNVVDLFGYPPEDFLTRRITYADLVHPDDLKRVSEEVEANSIDKRQRFKHKPYRVITKDQEVKWVADKTFIRRDAQKNITHYEGIIYDITERKRTQAALKESEKKYRLLFETMVNGVALHKIICDENGVPVDYRFLEVNATYESFTGLKAEDLLGKTAREIFPQIDLQQLEVYGTVALNEETITFEQYSQELDLHYEVTCYSPNQGEFVTILFDITGHIQAKENLQHLAMHDGLTGLPNRTLLTERLSYALKQAKHKKERIGVLFIDIDDFKSVNDTRGHKQGDVLLQRVAQRLRGTLRKSDTVARYAGDEFIGLLENIGNAEEAIPIAQKIIQAFSSPFKLDRSEITITCSIGISIYPADGMNTEMLLKSADQAMYIAKEKGKNNYHHFSK